MDYYLDLLLCLYKYLLGTSDCDNNIIRKHTRNLDKLGEFSFTVDTLKFCSQNTTCQSLENVNKFQTEMIQESKKWKLQISKCIKVNRDIHLYVEKVHSFKKVVEQVLQDRHEYGSRNLHFSDNIFLKTDFDEQNLNNLNLSQLRVLLIKDVSMRLINFAKRFSEKQQTTYIHVALNRNKNLKNKVILCGPVLSVNGTKNCTTTVTEFYRKRTIDMRQMAEHKYGVRITSASGWQDIFEKLGQAAVTIELLENKPSRTVTVNINDPTSSNSKGASFILYNCARLATLFKEFDSRVKTNVYPALPSIDNIDFGLLTQPEEWELLYLYVLQFPCVLDSCIKDILNEKINIHNLCSALSGMCSIFSVYYRRVRVLTEPRDHLFAVLHARVFLLKAVEQVLHNGLYLLNIQPVKQM